MCPWYPHGLPRRDLYRTRPNLIAHLYSSISNISVCFGSCYRTHCNCSNNHRSSVLCHQPDHTSGPNRLCSSPIASDKLSRAGQQRHSRRTCCSLRGFAHDLKPTEPSIVRMCGYIWCGLNSTQSAGVSLLGKCSFRKHRRLLAVSAVKAAAGG